MSSSSVASGDSDWEESPAWLPVLAGDSVASLRRVINSMRSRAESRIDSQRLSKADPFS
jgi:hypothetical protein